MLGNGAIVKARTPLSWVLARVGTVIAVVALAALAFFVLYR
jgi:hypothetical protein